MSDDEYENDSVISEAENSDDEDVISLVNKKKPVIVGKKVLPVDDDDDDEPGPNDEDEDEEVGPNDNDDDDEASIEQDSDSDAEDNEDEKEDEDEEKNVKNQKKTKPIKKISINKPIMTHIDSDDDEDVDELYLQKFDKEVNKNYIVDFHPECLMNNYEEVVALCQIVRDKAGNIVDELHKTTPFLTKYEKPRVLGQRAKQINSGAKAFVKVPPNVIDGYVIAEIELREKRIPFIIRRPIPGGGCEYWYLRDLEIIHF
jgi:DNA-directed RNA polymerase I, II, and III subunit RPABC2